MPGIRTSLSLSAAVRGQSFLCNLPRRVGAARGAGWVRDAASVMVIMQYYTPNRHPKQHKYMAVRKVVIGRLDVAKLFYKIIYKKQLVFNEE